MATKLQDGNTPCLAATPSDPRPTVLVFDSGVGGLSVYDEIRHLLPDLHYIYAFDNVAFPYGEKSEAFIVERVVEIVTAVQQRYPLSTAVIACNTASTVSLPALREVCFPGRGRGTGDQTGGTSDGKWCCRAAGNTRDGEASLYA